MPQISRFLTPYKICVLVGMDLYCAVYGHLGAIEKLLKWLLAELTGSTSPTDPPFTQVIANTLEIPAVGVIDEEGELCDETLSSYLAHRCKNFTSPHTLHEFILNLDKLLSTSSANSSEEDKIRIDPHSPFGIYIRRAILEVKKMEFDMLVYLWEGVVQYVTSPTAKDKSQTPLAMSTWSIEKFLDYQVSLFEKSSAHTLPPTTHQNLFSTLSLISTEPKTSYLLYLHAMNVGDFQLALENLMKYFDQFQDREGQSAAFQYGLWNVAILHCTFGHTEEAIWALRESLEIARSCADDEAVLYILGWIKYLEQDNTTHIPNLFEIHKSATAATTTTTPPSDPRSSLTSWLHVNSSRSLLKDGQSPSAVLEGMTRASLINSNSHSGQQGCVFGFESDVYREYGYTILSALKAQLQVSYGVHMNSPEELWSGMDHLMKLQESLETSVGLAESASTKFNHLKPFITRIWTMMQRRLVSRYLLQGNDMNSYWHNIVHYCHEDVDDAMTKCENVLLRTCGEMQYENYYIACKELIKSAKAFREQGEHVACARALLEVSKVKMEIGVPTDALPYLMSTISLSVQHRCSDLYYRSVIVLSELYTEMELPLRATEVIERNLPEILVHTDLETRGRAWLAFGKAALSQFNIQNEDEEEQKNVLMKAESRIARACKLFRHIRHWELLSKSLYLHARILHQLGSIHERNAIARELREVEEAMRRGKRYDDMVVGSYSVLERDNIQ